MTNEEIQEQIVSLEQLLDKLYNKRTQINKTIEQARKELKELRGEASLSITYNNRLNKHVLFAREPHHKPIYVTSRDTREEILKVHNECIGKTMQEIWTIKEKYRKRCSKTCKKYGGTLY